MGADLFNTDGRTETDIRDEACSRFSQFANALNDACLTASVARISPKIAGSAKLSFEVVFFF